MPGRISRSSLPSSNPKTARKANRKHAKRSLNAFAIAQHEAPDLHKIRAHRLGETEDDEPRRKRQRMTDDAGEDNDDEDEDEPSEPKRKQQKSVAKGRFDELDVSEGSDSEGNEWKMGVVDEDDDEDIDSDEAFGESDEERFEGFTFRGGSAAQKARGKQKRTVGRQASEDVEIDLNEEDEDEEADEDDEDDEDDDLGEDAIDLATMLDQGAESADEDEYEDEKSKIRSKGSARDHSQVEEEEDDEEEESEAPSEDDGEDSDVFADFDKDSDDDSPEKLKQLQNMVKSLPTSSPESAPAQADSSSAAARMLSALKGMSGLDPSLTRSLKTLARSTSPTRTSTKSTSNGMVKVPLPKRQQDRIDRSVAYDKAKETLNRWIDTVKHNRRAEHLSFPLVDPEAQEAQGTTKLLPVDSATKPRNELESTIADILQASGLGSAGSRADEEQLRGFEELKTNKMDLEEVLARRAELRKARDLMFREEAKSKRIKKIKSKAYRRVHRKEAQRVAQKERDMLAAAGVELSEDEQEAADRRRAEARMGGRHKDSRWARSVKETGRAAWDEDARDCMTAMARKNEEVRMRQEGTRIKGSDEEEGSDTSDDDDNDDDEFVLRNQLDKLDDNAATSGKSSKISQLAFMQRADAARRKQNDEDIARMRRELNGDEFEEDAEPAETSIGRRIFGPSQVAQSAVSRPIVRGELEEGRSDSEDDDEVTDAVDTAADSSNVPATTERSTAVKPSGQLKGPAVKAKRYVPVQAPPSPPDEATLDLARTSNQPQALGETSTAGNTDGWTTVHYSDNDDNNASDLGDRDGLERSASPTNFELVQAAFGTADDDISFAKEKAELEKEEDVQTTSTALPGWGSWAGTGLTKGERSHAARALANPALVKKSVDGVDPSKRKDRRLKDVIINERRNKKGAKYLAPMLPHQFETKAQYERSLRLPIGPEWTTKETFQQATKPRVVMKKGQIIKPMERPMV